MIVLCLYFLQTHFGISSFSHPDNALEVCGLLTPLHIVPEWYFLCQYAMLKAVPNKNAGFIILLTSILEDLATLRKKIPARSYQRLHTISSSIPQIRLNGHLSFGGRYFFICDRQEDDRDTIQPSFTGFRIVSPPLNSFLCLSGDRFPSLEENALSRLLYWLGRSSSLESDRSRDLEIAFHSYRFLSQVPPLLAVKPFNRDRHWKRRNHKRGAQQ